MAPTWPIGPTQQPTLTFGGLPNSATFADQFRAGGGLPMSTGPISSPFNIGVPVSAPKKFALFPLGTPYQRPAAPLMHPGQSISPNLVAGTGSAGWGANAATIASNLLASMSNAVTPAGWFSSPTPAPSSSFGGMMPMLLAGAAVLYLVIK